MLIEKNKFKSALYILERVNSVSNSRAFKRSTYTYKEQDWNTFIQELEESTAMKGD